MDPWIPLENKKVLITGASGFLGSALANRLGRAGCSLTLLVRPGGALRPLLPGRPPFPRAAPVIEADLADAGAVRKAVKACAPQVVFHLAALTDVRRDPALEEPCRIVNLEGTKNLAAALARIGSIQRLVHLGTCEEYGFGEAPFREEAPLRPPSPYARAKAEATRFLLDRAGEIPLVILRPFLAYGPGQESGRFIAQAVDAALEHRSFPMTRGEQTREFNHRDDLIEGIAAAACRAGIEGKVINLCCEEERRVLDVARMIFRLAESRAEPLPGALPYREGESMRFFGSAARCRALLDYVPKITLEVGLRSLIAWKRRNADVRPA